MSWRLPGKDRFGPVLLLLVVSYVFSALGGTKGPRLFESALAIGTMYLALRASAVGRRGRRLAAVLLPAGFATVVAVSLLAVPEVARGASELWITGVLLLTLLAVLRRILRHAEVSLETIYGALSAYVIIGLTFAALYGAVDGLSGSQFFAQVRTATNQDLQYFSFTTLTTLGYGDFTAVSHLGRALATLEAIIGQVFLATLIARLVANFTPRGPIPPPPPDARR